MSWSFRIGKLFGIEVRMHFTFVLLIGFISLRQWMETHDLGTAVVGVGFVVSLFACVLLHEFGHALTARKYGIQTQDITLLPIGGLARLERMPDKPMQEFWVALAGPAVNVVIAGVIFAYLFATSSLVPMDDLTITGASFLQRLATVNVFLVVFNMLPAFPMDGGRVLRALLATRMDYARATSIAARLGQVMAFGLGFLGLLGNPMLVIIALFVWIGAAQESGMVQLKSALGGLSMRQLMTTEFHTLSPIDSLAHAVELILKGFQHDFPVVDAEGRLVGVLIHGDLIAALAGRGSATLVDEVMQREFPFGEPVEKAEDVMGRLEARASPFLPILQNDRLVGILNLATLSEFMMIQTALLEGKTAAAILPKHAPTQPLPPV